MSGDQSNDLDNVVRNIYDETHKLWMNVRGQLGPKHDHGFKILYGPPYKEPSVLIVGLQPGGDSSNIRDAELRRPSEANEYLSESWFLSRELRKRFGEAFLKNALGTNVIFFRSPNYEKYSKNIGIDLRKQLENFCLTQTRRLIDAIKPKQLLLLGWDTLDLLGKTDFVECIDINKIINRPRRKRLLQKGEIQGIPTFASPHPSSAWRNPPITDVDWQLNC